jgi:putative transposase
VDYIHFNPVKHGLVKEARAWEYSSFHRCVAAGLYPLEWGGTQGDEIYGGERE